MQIHPYSEAQDPLPCPCCKYRLGLGHTGGLVHVFWRCPGLQMAWKYVVWHHLCEPLCEPHFLTWIWLQCCTTLAARGADAVETVRRACFPDPSMAGCSELSGGRQPRPAGACEGDNAGSLAAKTPCDRPSSKTTPLWRNSRASPPTSTSCQPAVSPAKILVFRANKLGSACALVHHPQLSSSGPLLVAGVPPEAHRLQLSRLG